MYFSEMLVSGHMSTQHQYPEDQYQHLYSCDSLTLNCIIVHFIVLWRDSYRMGKCFCWYVKHFPCVRNQQSDYHFNLHTSVHVHVKVYVDVDESEYIWVVYSAFTATLGTVLCLRGYKQTCCCFFENLNILNLNSPYWIEIAKFNSA